MLTASNFPIGKIHRPVALPLWVGFLMQNAKCKMQNALVAKLKKCVNNKIKSEKLIR